MDFRWTPFGIECDSERERERDREIDRERERERKRERERHPLPPRLRRKHGYTLERLFGEDSPRNKPPPLRIAFRGAENPWNNPTL